MFKFLIDTINQFRTLIEHTRPLMKILCLFVIYIFYYNLYTHKTHLNIYEHECYLLFISCPQ